MKLPPPLSSALRRLSTPATYWAEAEYVGRRSGERPRGSEKKRREEEVFFSFPVFGRLKRGGGGGGEPHSQGRDGQTDGAVPTEKKGEWDSPNGNPCNCTKSQERARRSCFNCANLDCLFYWPISRLRKPISRCCISPFPSFPCVCCLASTYLGKREEEGAKLAPLGLGSWVQRWPLMRAHKSKMR